MPNPDGSLTYTEQQAAERKASEDKYFQAYNAWKVRAAMEAHGGAPAGPKPVYGGATNLVEPNSAAGDAGNGNTDLGHSYASQAAYDSGAPPTTAFNNGTLDERPLEPVATGGAYGPSPGGEVAVAGADPSLFPGATIDTRQSEEIRGAQLAYLGQLADRAAGRAPSVAGAQYDIARGDIARNSLGIAAQARGADQAAARRSAMLGLGDQTQRMALGQALLRAQETTAAQQLQGQALAGVRGQDTGLAEAQAGLTQETQRTKFGEAGVTARATADLAERARQRAQTAASQRYQVDKQAQTAAAGTGFLDKYVLPFVGGVAPGIASAAVNAYGEITKPRSSAQAYGPGPGENGGYG